MADTCERCGHPFDPHAIVACTVLPDGSIEPGDPMSGGVILCPEPGCLCMMTWAPTWPGKPKGEQPPIRPRADAVAELRATLFL